ncbi:MAG: NUDIX hydrolase [Candidatus Zixiibacteriota bacterium]
MKTPPRAGESTMTDENRRHDPGNYRFCPYCRAALVRRQDGAHERLRCPDCDFVYYHNPVPAAGGVIHRNGAICLVRRAVEPRKGHWSLPAGFMEYNEAPRECARREIREETGLDVTVGDVLGVYCGFDDPRQHAVLIVFWTRELTWQAPVAGDDADAIEFFPPSAIPDDIAFRAHREALQDVLRSGRVSPAPGQETT